VLVVDMSAGGKVAQAGRTCSRSNRGMAVVEGSCDVGCPGPSTCSILQVRGGKATRLEELPWSYRASQVLRLVATSGCRAQRCSRMRSARRKVRLCIAALGDVESRQEIKAGSDVGMPGPRLSRMESARMKRLSLEIDLLL